MSPTDLDDTEATTIARGKPGLTPTRTVRVLVVEDNEDQRLLIERALAGPLVDVLSVGTGTEAEYLLDHVDLVLIDHGLPDMTGIELLERVTSLPNGPSGILVTANDNPATVVEALRHGAVDYVRKQRGYLGALPDVVMRAWRQHDLAQRTRELQRLVLLLHRAADAEGVADEIVTGARRLLHASECILVADRHGEWVVEARTGASQAADELLRRLPDLVRAPGDLEVIDHRHIVVSLAHTFAEQRGILLLLDVDAPLQEELELAETFAAFAATALDDARRRETEQALIAELRTTVEARRAFLASVSHELRTPLTSINGYSETLMTRWGDLDDEMREDCLTRIRRNGAELRRLVEQLIDVASFERGHDFLAEPEAVPIGEHVRDAVANLGKALEGREIRVEGGPVVGMVDRALFQRAVTNLLTNAVKYSRAGEPIEITIRSVGGEAVVAVTDHGIGMDEHVRGHVFEPFWRAPHAIEHAIRGSGIGLTLVRQYLLAMGGSVDVDSAPGAGSTFTLRVPALAG